MATSDLYVGLISGTSIDGVDCVLVQFDAGRPELVATHAHKYPDALRAQVLSLCAGDPALLQSIGETHVALGKLFAEAVHTLLSDNKVAASDVTAIGSHGQTVWHEPEGSNPFTLQLADPNTIAQLTDIDTVADFRGRDMAAGGQGAPLAPILHQKVFRSETADRAIVNIGGIGNITYLPTTGNCLAFDTGPGNVLMDYWAEHNLQTPFDINGEWAASGVMQLELLNALLADPYFQREPPKSTGRERFNGKWLQEKLKSLGGKLKPEDVQATLLTFTASTIVSDLTQFTNAQEVYVCGGGAHNAALMNELAKLAGEQSVHSTTRLGVDPDWVEAMCFAYLARQAINGEKVDTTSFTGATSPVRLGGIYRA